LKKILEDRHGNNSTECVHFPEASTPDRSRQSFGKTFEKAKQWISPPKEKIPP